MSEVKRSASMARRRSLPSARMCCWPAISARVRGRMRAASGSLMLMGALLDDDSSGVKSESMATFKMEGALVATEN